MAWWSGQAYVSAAEKRERARRAARVYEQQGRVMSPVVIEGKKIATTFWGKGWCDHLEKFGDYESRLPRGRVYAKNGSVIDLQVERGKVRALVAGSSMYTVKVEVDPASEKLWGGIKQECAGQIASVIELLQGTFSAGVMGVMTRVPGGLFPLSKEIDFHCNCPDYAHMCKHVAAVLYGIGARLDREPELLFTLRGVDPVELVAMSPTLSAGAAAENEIAADDLEAIFGITLAPEPVVVEADKPARERGKPTRKRDKPAGERISPAAKRRKRSP